MTEENGSMPAELSAVIDKSKQIWPAKGLLREKLT